MRESRILYCKVETENDTSSFYNMSLHDQTLAVKWIMLNLRHIKSFNEYRTSYGLKHCLEHDTGLYMGNNAFKEAMLLCGFVPFNAYSLNWVYRVGEFSPAFKHRGGAFDKDGICNIKITDEEMASVDAWLKLGKMHKEDQDADSSEER